MTIATKVKRIVKKTLPFLVPYYSFLRNTRPIFTQWRPTYNKGGLITDRFCDFMTDPRFRKSFDTAVREGHVARSMTPIEYVVYVAVWAAEQGVHLDGDFVECGVAQGLLCRTIMEYIDFNKLDRKFYLIDTYDGFDRRYPPTRVSEGPRFNENMSAEEFFGAYDDMYPFVKKAFAKFPNAIIVKGPVPDVLEEVRNIKKVAYLSIDMNRPIPEIAAAEFFWDKMVSGAILLLDDYNIVGHNEQHAAFNAFAKQKNVSILALPTGQGLIIKP